MTERCIHAWAIGEDVIGISGMRYADAKCALCGMHKLIPCPYGRERAVFRPEKPPRPEPEKPAQKNKAMNALMRAKMKHGGHDA